MAGKERGGARRPATKLPQIQKRMQKAGDAGQRDRRRAKGRSAGEGRQTG